MARRALAAVPETAPRAVLYGRVSAVMGRGDDLTSPELQEHVVREYCVRRGYDPVSWTCDVDMTGRSWSRRSVEQAVKMIEAGEADVIVVPRWSRFTRNLRDYVIQTARIEAAGGRIESALEETDPATAAGLLQRDLFAILAQWESRVKGEQWKETHERRRRSGLPHNMAKRCGYQIEDGRYVIDPEVGPRVTELYERYLNGAGIAGLCHWLGSVGVFSPQTGKKWTPRGLRLFMENGFAAGLLHVGDTYIPGAQEPLISKEIWEAYGQARRQRRGVPPRLMAPSSALSGIVYCGACNQRMRLKHDGNTGKPGYMFICEVNVQCENRAAVTRKPLEEHVKSWLQTIADEGDVRADAEAAQRASATVNKVDRTQLLRELTKVDKAIVQNRADHLLGSYSVAERDSVDALLREQKINLEERLLELRDSEPGKLPPVDLIRHLLANWDGIPAATLNQLIRQVIHRVEVLRLPGWRQKTITLRPVWEA